MVNESFPAGSSRENFAGWLVNQAQIAAAGGRHQSPIRLESKGISPWHGICKVARRAA
jgi:hypothetical protein